MMEKHASCLILVDSQNRLILQKRSKKNNVFFAGCWGLIGGEAFCGETDQECILRECKEETGWSPNQLKFLFTKNEHCVESVFMSYIDSVDHLECYEGDELRAFALRELPKLNISKYHNSIIERALEIRQEMLDCKKRPAVLFYTKILPPAFGGYVTAGINLFRVISKVFDVTLVSDDTVEEIILQNQRYDLLFFNATYEKSDVFFRLSKLCNQVWSYEHNKYSKKYCSEMKYRFEHANKIIVPSTYLSNTFFELYNEKMLSLSVLPLPIDEKIFVFSPDKMSEVVKFCTFCALKKGRCLEKNISVIKKLKDLGINCEYHIYGAIPFGGEEDYLFRLQEYIKQNNANEYVSIFPAITGFENVYKVLKMHDFYLDLSEQETYGQAKLEAIFAGLGLFITSAENNKYLLPYNEEFYDDEIDVIANKICLRINNAKNNFDSEAELRKNAVNFAKSQFGDDKIKTMLENMYYESI